MRHRERQRESRFPAAALHGEHANRAHHHKHSREDPRALAVMPQNRTVSPKRYLGGTRLSAIVGRERRKPAFLAGPGVTHPANRPATTRLRPDRLRYSFAPSRASSGKTGPRAGFGIRIPRSNSGRTISAGGPADSVRLPWLSSGRTISCTFECQSSATLATARGFPRSALSPVRSSAKSSATCAGSLPGPRQLRTISCTFECQK